VTPSPTAGQATQLTNAFNDAYQYIRFIYFATNAITNLQTNVASLRNDMQNIETFNIAHLKGNSSTLRTRVGDISISINQTNLIINMLTSDSSLFETATTQFSNWTLTNLKDTFSRGIDGLLDSLFVSNPVQGFGACAMLANDIKFVDTAMCTLFNQTIAGLWFCYFLIGLFLFIGFISAMKTKKRIEYLERRAVSVKNFGKGAGQPMAQIGRTAYMA
jgi:hypothetical protein